MKKLLHLILIIFLTVLSQIGGVLYLVSILVINRDAKQRRLKRIVLFLLIYLGATFLIVPVLAPVFGREKIKETKLVTAHSFFTKLLNRNYVRPELNRTLEKISTGFNKKHPGIKVVYLDANFPFINNFPLLPHLSHNDGKKLDLSLVYQDSKGVLSNKKRSMSGYGVYENPQEGAGNQTTSCKNKGYWQYDFPKYLTFGSINKEVHFSVKGTRGLILEILEQPEIGKIFIEPHLKIRLKLKNNRIRFHGCQAVRHDDHIHLQLK